MSVGGGSLDDGYDSWRRNEECDGVVRRMVIVIGGGSDFFLVEG